MKTGISASQAIERIYPAKGAITKGDLLLLENDSGILKAKKYIKEAFFSSCGVTLVSNQGFDNCDVAFDNNGNIVIAYTNSSNYYLYCVVGIIQSNGSIVWSTPQAVISTGYDSLRICYAKKLNKFICAGKSSSVTNVFQWSLSGTTITSSNIGSGGVHITDIIYDEKNDVIYVISLNDPSFTTNILLFYNNGINYQQGNGIGNFRTANNAGSFLFIKDDSVYIGLRTDNANGLYTNIYKLELISTTSVGRALDFSIELNYIRSNANFSPNGNEPFLTGKWTKEYNNKIITISRFGSNNLYSKIENNIKKICAIAEETVLDTYNCKILFITPFITANFFTGLSLGNMYFINSNDGTLQAGDGIIPLGKAISSTEILLLNPLTK